MEYELVNPSIIGNFQTVYKTLNVEKAVEKFWKNLSKHITNNVPKIYVTFKDGSGTLHHFKITEKLNSDSKTADYKINKIDSKLSKAQKDHFLSEVAKVKDKFNVSTNNQDGGKHHRRHRKHHKDDSSSTSSSYSKSSTDTDSMYDDTDDYFDFAKFRNINQPITYWWYTPSIYSVKNVYVPTFNVPLTPYIENYTLWMPMN
jgi:hypothetical protein